MRRPSNWIVALTLIALSVPVWAEEQPWDVESLDRSALAGALAAARSRSSGVQPDGDDAQLGQAAQRRVESLTTLIAIVDAAKELARTRNNERRLRDARAALADLASTPTDTPRQVREQDDLGPYKKRAAAADALATEQKQELARVEEMRSRLALKGVDELTAETKKIQESLASAEPAQGALAEYQADNGRLELRRLREELALISVRAEAWHAWLEALRGEADLANARSTRAQRLLDRASQTVAKALKAEEARGAEAAAAEARDAEKEDDPVLRFRKRVRAEISRIKIAESRDQQRSIKVDQRALESKTGLSRLADDRQRVQARLGLSGGASDKIATLLRDTLVRLKRTRALVRQDRVPWVYRALDEVQTARAETQDRIWELDVPLDEGPLFLSLMESLSSDEEVRTSEARRAYQEVIVGPEGLLPTLRRRASEQQMLYSKLVSLESGSEGYATWLAQIDELNAFVTARIYWVRTDNPVGPETLEVASGEARKVAEFFVDGRHWSGLPDAPRERPAAFYGLLLTLLATIGVAFWLRQNTPTSLARWTRSGGPIWKATKQTLATLARAAVWPLCLSILAAWLRSIDVEGGALTPVAHAAQLVAHLWFGWRFVRRFLSSEGVAIKQFGMAPALAGQLRQSASVALLSGMLFYIPKETLSAPPFHYSGLPRLLHILFLVASFSAICLVIPRRKPLARMWVGTRGTWYGLWGLLAPLLALLLAGIVVMDALGYRIGANALATNVVRTLFAALVLSGLYFVLRRATQAAAARVLEREKQEAGKKQARQVSAIVMNQLTRLTSVVVLAAAALILAHFWELDRAVGNALEPIQLAQMGDGHYMSLWDLIRALALIIFAHFVVRNMGGLLEFVVFPLAGATDTGTRYVFATLSRYAILVLAWSVALMILHFSFSTIGWLLAAASVGIGFGLQEIVANFVSGIILLLERPVRVGDIISVGDTWGTIDQIRARATHVINRDRKMVLIPNKEMITSRVTNWTHNDRAVRRMVAVGVSYGSDVVHVLEILREVADAHPQILKKPPTRIWFTSFGNSSLDFELYFFADAEGGVDVRSQLYEAIFARFAEEGIEIPFPQRDLHIRSGALIGGEAAAEASKQPE